MVKQIVDRICALIGLVLLLPVIVFVAVFGRWAGDFYWEVTA